MTPLEEFNKRNQRTSTAAAIVGAVFKIAAAIALGVLALFVATFVYNTAAHVWHLPSMSMLQLLCSVATLGAVSGAIGSGFRKGSVR
jgi:Na+/melibiose symporter-like transporter